MAEDRVDAAVQRHLEAGSWDDLGVVEHEGGLHFPAKLQRRKADGSLRTVDVMLRCPTNAQRMKARVRSREWAAELKLDLDKDRDLVDELETYELLAFCVRDSAAPFDQHVFDGKALFKDFLSPELSALWARLNVIIDVTDPRFGELGPAEIWEVAKRIAAHGEPSPLGDLPGFEQATCITFLAREALKSPTAPSSARSPSTSG